MKSIPHVQYLNSRIGCNDIIFCLIILSNCWYCVQYLEKSTFFSIKIYAKRNHIAIHFKLFSFSQSGCHKLDHVWGIRNLSLIIRHTSPWDPIWTIFEYGSSQKKYFVRDRNRCRSCRNQWDRIYVVTRYFTVSMNQNSWRNASSCSSRKYSLMGTSIFGALGRRNNWSSPTLSASFLFVISRSNSCSKKIHWISVLLHLFLVT